MLTECVAVVRLRVGKESLRVLREPKDFADGDGKASWRTRLNSLCRKEVSVPIGNLRASGPSILTRS